MQFIPGNRQMTDSKWSDEVFKRTLLRSSNADETSYYNDGYVFDNTSRTYIDMCAGCQDQPVMMVALRWAKLLILKVGRMYYGAPLCLMLLPMLVGMYVGYRMGTRATPTTTRKTSGVSVMASLWRSAILILQHLPVATFWLSFQTTFGSQVLAEKEDITRKTLRSDVHTHRESGVPLEKVPRHVAVIMDGNRRYGRSKYGNATQGHWDGSKTLVDFSKWCIAEGVQILSVYAFSTENWHRDPVEVASLMALFCKYCDELRSEAIDRNIRIRVLSTETERIPASVKAGLARMERETAHCEGGLTLNICLSYGSRGEIVKACQQMATEVKHGILEVNQIDDLAMSSRLLTTHCPDPDVVIRTSGEYRLSNFLLWQLAYAELFFLQKTWPELEKGDLIEVIRDYAEGRSRRFGK